MSTPTADDRTAELGPPPPPPRPPLVGGDGFDRDRVARRVAIVGVVAAVVLGVLLLRLWSLQVLDVREYRAQASSNGIRSTEVPAPRGRILDREGRVLVGTRPANAIAIDPAAFPGLLEACGRDVAGPLDGRAQDERARRIAAAIEVANRLPRQRREARLAEIQRQLDGRGPTRAWRGCTREFPELRELATLAGVRVIEMEDRIHDAAATAPFDSIAIADDVDREVLFYLKERADAYPGIRVVEGTARSYRTVRGSDGRQYALAPHLWGELGSISAEQIVDQVTYRDARPGDVVGQRGVERAFDRYLRGTDGSLERRVNAFGEPEGRIVRSQAAKPGEDVQLTIDARLQAEAETALRDAIAYARGNGFRNADGGAIVAMDPRDGAILAIASYPGFDPADLAGPEGRQYWNRLVAETERSPLLDRALSGLYPAGSTYKPVTAIAAVQGRVATANELIQCSPFMDIDGQRYRNFESDVDEPMNLVRSLSTSCDTYYYELGQRLYDATPRSGRFEPQPLWARRLGFGAPTGLDIGGDASGRVPDAAYKARRFGDDPWNNRWSSGDAVLQSIGQGDVEVTPLQVARLYALLANGGTLVTPHVGYAVLGQDGTVRERLEAAPGEKVPVDPYTLAAIRRGLEDAVQDPDGTAYDAFAGFPIPVAGKTGTAEKLGKRDFAWFVAYAPADDPQIVVAAVIEEGGFGGVTTAPAVRQLLAKALGVDEATIAQIAAAQEAGVYDGPVLGAEEADE